MPSTNESQKPAPVVGWFSASVGLAVLVLTLMLATEPLLPIVWDEGFTLMRLARVRAWLAAVRDPEPFAARWNPRTIGVPLDDVVSPPLASEINTRSKLFSARVIRWFWPPYCFFLRQLGLSLVRSPRGAEFGRAFWGREPLHFHRSFTRWVIMRTTMRR
jgi:hypothetical protein